MQNTDSYYLNQKEPAGSCLLALRELILAADSALNESLKWNMPCFSFKGKMFCFLWTDKKTGEPYILFAEGNRLNHPALETGSRSRMKIFRICPTEDLPVREINLLLEQALDLYKSGIISVKK